MLCGTLPFHGKTISSLQKKFLRGKFKFPDYLSTDAKDLIKNLAQTDPLSRLSLNDVKDHPWFNVKPCSPFVRIDNSYGKKEKI